jgi:hypothetical protein
MIRMIGRVCPVRMRYTARRMQTSTTRFETVRLLNPPLPRRLSRGDTIQPLRYTVAVATTFTEFRHVRLPHVGVIKERVIVADF